jgi:hypothetical protein
MVNHARITESGIDAKVIHIIPRSGVRGQAQMEVRKAGMLGYRCPDYVLEGRLKKLHGLRNQKIISARELDEMCSEEFDRTVSASQNKEYLGKFQELLARHNHYQGSLSRGEQLEEIYQLMGEYR